MSKLGMFPVILFKDYVPFPGQVFPLSCDLSSKIPEGSRVMDVWGNYFERGSMILCAVSSSEAGHGVRTVRAGKYAEVKFYEDAVWAEVEKVSEKESGKILLTLETLSKFKILQASYFTHPDSEADFPFPLATQILEVNHPEDADYISSDSLYRLSVLLRGFLEKHKDKINSDNHTKAHKLTVSIEDFLKKNPERDPIRDRKIINVVRSGIYHICSKILHLVFDVSDIHLVLTATDIREEVEDVCDLISGEGDISLGTPRQRFSEVAKHMHLDLAKEVDRAISRLEIDNNTTKSSEIQTTQTWVDFVLGLPWGIYTKDNEDLVNAEKILNEDHTGVDKVKEKIIEILAIRKQNPKAKGPILAFVGPPGVGKTSLGRAIARALGRNFRRVSLGGVRDEAEIRGHRKTYIGSYAGQILMAIQRAGSMNPLIVLDEVDKLKDDYKGDPSAALMEVLDPEQNHEFVDHYLGTSFDLSNVIFICTANAWSTIPEALRDRMERISIPGYTEREKIHIVKKQLIPRHVVASGMEASPAIEIPDETLSALISGYTFESGLRNLDREVGSIFRKVVKKRLKDGEMLGAVTITPELLRQLLGRPRNTHRKCYVTLPGEAIGLAVIGFGVGDIMPAQCTIVPGRHRKEFSQPAKFGQSMRNANKQGLSRVKNYLKDHNRKDLLEIFDKNLVQVIFPDDDSGIDGPSAGVAVFLAILSKLYERPLKQGLAMTGKIDALGRVLAIGGVKEKVLAAERAGIKAVMIPKDNEAHLDDIDPEDRAKIRIYPISTLDEAIEIAFEGGLENRKK